MKNRVLRSTSFVPGVSLAGKDSLHESLRWHPLDRQHGTTAFPVIAGSGKRGMESDDEDWREIHRLVTRRKKYNQVGNQPVDVSSHSKVSDFGHSFRSGTGEQTISGSDVSDKTHNQLNDVSSDGTGKKKNEETNQ